MTEREADRTRLFARALGPFLLAVAVMVFLRYETLYLLLPAFRQDLPLTLTAGALVLLIGLLILSAHHHFNSPTAIGVSVVAILLVIRGASLLLAPELVLAMANGVVRAPLIMLLVSTLAGLTGAWLAFAGWFSKTL